LAGPSAALVALTRSAPSSRTRSNPAAGTVSCAARVPVLDAGLMPPYWWECCDCRAKFDFQRIAGVRGMPDFVWDHLVPAGWDQSVLVRPCPTCRKVCLRVGYQFPRRNNVGLLLIHAVGLGPIDDYVPMMWETQPDDSDDTFFDFKYVRGRSVWGLNKPAVFSRINLRVLFGMFAEKTGQPFP